MPWRVSHVMNERMRFVVRLQEGERMTDLCREFGISRKTGYKFRQRYREFGPGGLFDESRRPLRPANETPEEIKRLILALKRERPTWGAKKLRSVLEQGHPGIRLPVLSTIQLLLAKNGLVKRQRRRRHRGLFFQKQWTESSAPNEVWSADFKGQFRMGNGAYCYPLTISDHYSRYLISCEGLDSTNVLAAKGVFESAFRQHGLPRVIRTNNGPPFATTGIAGLSRLSVWWMRLGIGIERIEPGHPEQNGRHERMHLTLKQHATRPPAGNLLQQQERFDDFVEEYNSVRPHEGLDMRRPADLYSRSRRDYPDSLPDPEYPLHDMVRGVSNVGKVHLIGRSKDFFIGAALGGQKLGLRETEEGRWLVTFMDMDLGYVDEKTRSFEPIAS